MPPASTIAGPQQRLENALFTRRVELDKLSDQQWEQLALGTQEAVYTNLLTEIELVGHGVEQLKPEAKLAGVLERHMWALWLKRTKSCGPPASTLAARSRIA
jgi:hypothetical protein